MDVQAAKMIGAGLATLGMIGAGIGLGNIFSNLLSAISRNPEASNDLFPKAMVGAALTEIIALLAFAIAILILFL